MIFVCLGAAAALAAGVTALVMRRRAS